MKVRRESEQWAGGQDSPWCCHILFLLEQQEFLSIASFHCFLQDQDPGCGCRSGNIRKGRGGTQEVLVAWHTSLWVIGPCRKWHFSPVSLRQRHAAGQGEATTTGGSVSAESAEDARVLLPGCRRFTLLLVPLCLSFLAVKHGSYG